MMVTPLLAVLMLRELGFAAWQYGLRWAYPQGVVRVPDEPDI